MNVIKEIFIHPWHEPVVVGSHFIAPKHEISYLNQIQVKFNRLVSLAKSQTFESIWFFTNVKRLFSNALFCILIRFVI